MRILVTGAAGFIGSAFVHHVLANHPGDEVIGLDLLTYAGNMANLSDLHADARFRFVQADIADAKAINDITDDVDAIVAGVGLLDGEGGSTAATVRWSGQAGRVLLVGGRLGRHETHRY